MTVQGTLGSLLQGVSQQPARIRVPGQLTDQVNMHSDVSTGLTSRPATEVISTLANATDDLKFQTISLAGTDFILGYKNNLLRAWDADGAEVVVNNGTDTYIGADMRFSVYDNSIYATNRDQEVSMDSSTQGRAYHYVYVSALGGYYSRDYKLTISPEGESDIEVEYTTPDGTNSAHVERTSATYILGQLKDELDLLTLPAGMTVTQNDETLMIRWDDTMTASVDDGDAGAVLRVITDDGADQTQLPKYAEEGSIVKIIGDPVEDDDYFLRFNIEDNTTDGTGFGELGIWEEWFDVEQPNALDLSTMPHVLTHDGSEFTLAEGAWLGRRVGSPDTNPDPSFIGGTIRDIGGFENRLVFVSGPNCIMSQSEEPLDFFRKSATALIDSDPIDMNSSVDNSLQLDWIIPFDRDLILLSDPGDNQFVVSSGGITPDNASLVLTTSYEMFGLTRPVTTGRTLIFPFKSGVYTGIKEFFTNDSVATNGADTLTEVQNRYITGVANKLASSKNFNLVLVGTNDADQASSLWAYKYLWDGFERLQSSWSRWDFPHEVLHVYFDNSEVRLVLNDPTGITLCKMDLNKVDDAEGWHVTLDMKDTRTVASGAITVPEDDYVVVQSTGCDRPGVEVLPTSVTGSGPYTYNLDPDIAPDTATVYIGKRVTVSCKPTMPLIRDQAGNVVSAAKLVLQKFMVHLDNSSDVLCRMTSPFRDTYDFYPRRFPLDDDPLDPQGLLIKDYVLEVPWGERSDYSELELISTDVRPTTILEVEWQGQVTGSRRRV